MLRLTRLFLAGLALFAIAAGAGVLVASRWGPERTRVVLELALSDALDRPVAVRQARLYFGGGPVSWVRGVLLDAKGIESRPDRPGEAPDLVIARLQAKLDPISLLSGRVELRSVALDGVQARIDSDLGAKPGGDPAMADDAVFALLDPAEDAEPVVGWLEAVAVAAERALAAIPAGSDISLTGADLRLLGPERADGEAPWVLQLHGVAGEGRLQPWGHRSRVTLAGQLEDFRGGAENPGLDSSEGAGSDARIEVELECHAGGALSIDVTVTNLALGHAAPAFEAILPSGRLTGRSDLSLSLQRPQEGVWRVSARAYARDVGGAIPRMGDGQPVPMEVAKADAGLDLDLDPERLRLTRAFVTIEGSEISLAGEIERPLRMDSSTVGRFGLDRYDLRHRDDLIAYLPPRQIATLKSALEPLRSGWVEDVRVEGQAPLREWLQAFDDEAEGLLPESMEARARFAGFAVRAGEDTSLTDLSGQVSWSGDRLELHGVRGRRSGHWMPVLDASLTGLSHLAANRGLPEIPDAEDAPLMLGLGPMYDIVVDPNKPPGEMPKALLLSLDHVVHPTLIWPLRNLFARANPGEDGIRLLLEHGVWGRVPVRAEGIWSMEANGERRVERVAVRIEAKPPLEDLPPLELSETPSDAAWARGRWHLDAHQLGNWHVLTSTGAFEAVGQDVRLDSYDLDLGIAGHVLGHGTVDFSNGEELAYRTELRMVDAQAQGVVDKIGFEAHEATGTVTMEGQLHGELRPGRRVMAGMEGTLSVSARDGVILRRLPVVLALAKATDTFNPFGSRNEIRYSEIDAALRLERGQVHAEELRISGPDLRLLATGQVDAVDPEHPVKAVVGIFFFKALDRVIGVVPLLSNLILGEDDNLVGAYVQLTGPWEHPDADLVPLKTMATGPASFAVEGVPRFVRRAIAAIQSAFSRPGVSAPPPGGEDS